MTATAAALNAGSSAGACEALGYSGTQPWAKAHTEKSQLSREPFAISGISFADHQQVHPVKAWDFDAAKSAK